MAHKKPKGVSWRDVGRLKTRRERRANVPLHLRLSEKDKERLIKENRENIAELVADGNSPFLRLPPADRARARAPRLAEEADQARAIITGMISRARNRASRKMLERRLANVNAQFAAALADMGEFDRAAEFEPDLERKAEYQSFHKAVWLDDAAACECEPLTISGVTLHHQFEERTVWSIKHQRTMPVITCNECGHRNVREFPKELARAKGLRAKARQLVRKGTGPHDAANILRGARLTSAEVFKST